MIDYGDGIATVLHSRHQRARLRHLCTECRRSIEPGETYLAERTVFDGTARSHKVCAHCQRVRDYLMDHCGGWMYGGLHEDISDHHYSSTSNDAETRNVRLLTLGMHAGWRRTDGSLWPVPRNRTPKFTDRNHEQRHHARGHHRRNCRP